MYIDIVKENEEHERSPGGSRTHTHAIILRCRIVSINQSSHTPRYTQHTLDIVIRYSHATIIIYTRAHALLVFMCAYVERTKIPLSSKSNDIEVSFQRLAIVHAFAAMCSTRAHIEQMELKCVPSSHHPPPAVCLCVCDFA